MSQPAPLKLPLKVPRIENSRYGSLDTSPQAVLHEIQQLPYSDINCALTLARHKLAGFNRFKVAAQNREAAIAPFNYAFQRFIQHYRNFHKQSRYSAPPEQSDLEAMALFTQELAYGYKLTFLDYLENGDKQHLIAKSLYGALYYIGQSMLQSYEQNLWQSPTLWREAHCLYRIAEERGFLGQEIQCDLPKPRPLTIDGLYFQMLFTSLADPYQLSHGLHWFVFDYAGRWSHKIMAYGIAEAPPVQYGFIVKLDSGKPPLPIRGIPTMENQQLRIIASHELARTVASHAQQIQQGHTHRLLGFETQFQQDDLLKTLRHLHFHWSEKPLRKNRREDLKEKVQLVWGIPDLFLLHDPVAREYCASRNETLNIQNHGYARIENESESGYCALLDNALKSRVYCGQLVAILRTDAQRRRIEIGAIQWANTYQSNLLRVGIKRIDAKVRAVCVALEKQDDHNRQGLLLIYSDNGRFSQSLIVPNDYLESGCTAYALQPGMEHWCKLTTLSIRQQTAAFDWFDVDIDLED